MCGNERSRRETAGGETSTKAAKLEAARHRVQELVEHGRFAKAEAILQKMEKSTTEEEFADFRNWVTDELERLQTLPKTAKGAAPQLYETARDFMVRHDYGEAARLLQQIPSGVRTPEVTALLRKAVELQDEAEFIITDLQQCVTTRTYDGIEDNVRRLLELKPKSKFAQDLWAALQTYQSISPARRTYRFDEHGHLQPHDREFRRWLVAGAGVFIVVFGVMSWLMYQYMSNDTEDSPEIAVGDLQDVNNAAPVEVPAARALGEPLQAPPAENWSDLLAPSRIELINDGWEYVEDEGTLQYDANGNATQVIFEPTMPAGYEVDIDFSTTADINQFGVTLPIAGGLCQFMLFARPPVHGGLEFVDGKNFRLGETVVSERLLGDVSRNLRITVDSTPATTTVVAECDGREIFHWSGATNRLSLDNAWNHERPGKLAIGTGTAPASRREGRNGNCEVTLVRWRTIDETDIDAVSGNSVTPSLP